MKLITLVRDFFYHIYIYREYLKQSVARDLRKRYKRSVLGYLWSMLNPLFMMIILTVVFSNIMKQNNKDYAVFLFSAMLPWSYFSSTVHGALGAIRANARIIDQVAVPKYIFPLSIAFSGIVDLLLSLIPLLIVMLFLRFPISPTILTVPIVLIPLFFFTVGVSLVVSAMNVFFEDTGHLVDVALRAIYFLCPILYGREHLPEWLIRWVILNPLFSIIEFMRGLFYGGQLPAWNIYTLSFLGCFSILVLGIFIFNRADKKFVYFI